MMLMMMITMMKQQRKITIPGLLMVDPKQRMTITDLLNNPWLQGNNQSALRLLMPEIIPTTTPPNTINQVFISLMINMF